MAAPCGDVGGISGGGGQNPIAFKLHSRDWKILLGTMALMITLGSVTVTIMFYVLTPRQVHDADIAKTNETMAVQKALADERAKSTVDVQLQLVEQSKAIQTLHINQTVEMLRRGIPEKRIEAMPAGLITTMPAPPAPPPPKP